MATWDEVSAALGTDTRQLLRWRKRPGTPTLPDVALWLEWRAKQADAKAAAKADGKTVSDDAALPGECDYDQLVKDGKISYETAKEREQVIGIALQNQARKLETDKVRATLVTRDEAERGIMLARDGILRVIETTIGAVLVKHVQMPADQRALLINEVMAELEDA